MHSLPDLLRATTSVLTVSYRVRGSKLFPRASVYPRRDPGLRIVPCSASIRIVAAIILSLLSIVSLGCRTFSRYADTYKAGVAAEDRKDYAKAITLYERAIQQEPRFAPPYGGLGDVHRLNTNGEETANGYYIKCIDRYERIRDLQGNACGHETDMNHFGDFSYPISNCYWYLALSLLGQGQFALAADSLFVGCRLRPIGYRSDCYTTAHTALTYSNRPSEAADAGRRSKAWKELRTLYDAGNYDHYAWARVYERNGLPQEAQEEIALAERRRQIRETVRREQAEQAQFIRALQAAVGAGAPGGAPPSGLYTGQAVGTTVSRNPPNRARSR